MVVHADSIGQVEAADLAEVFARSLSAGVVQTSDTVVVLYNLSRFRQALNFLKGAFPLHALHALAVKANPALELLKIANAEGCGAEVASLGELYLAHSAGIRSDNIVFDSPAKTYEELITALKLGVTINANCIEELDRIKSLPGLRKSKSRIGLRINPEIGIGTIGSTSVATPHSKFGVPLSTSRDAISRAFAEYSWLTGLHVHIGSQGMSVPQLLEGTGAVYDLFLELQSVSSILMVDIGGGLPSRYRKSDPLYSFEEYSLALRIRCPALFSSGVLLITEFGRSIHSNCGYVAAKVEYVIKDADGGRTVVAHVGADMFIRKAYRPDDWHHDITVCDATGRLRVSPKVLSRVAGPLCFAGDYLDRNALLPEDTESGDYLLIHDAGAYTFSMWSLYNSRQFPAIIGYENQGESFRYLRPRQTIEQIVDFWSAE